MPASSQTTKQLVRLVNQLVAPSQTIERLLRRHGRRCPCDFCRHAGRDLENHLRALSWNIDAGVEALFLLIDEVQSPAAGERDMRALLDATRLQALRSAFPDVG
jgi:hypothetical protein